MSEHGAPVVPGSMLIDVTAPIRPGMAVWPGDPEVEFTPVMRIAAGEEANVSRVSLSTHTGTHVDVPWHFIDDGPTLDDLPIGRWIGACVVVDVSLGTGPIGPEDLSAIPEVSTTPFVVLKTRSGGSPAAGPSAFDPVFAALTLDGARWLVGRGVQLVGIDTPSVEAADGNGDVHRELLRAGTLIVEGLELRDVAPGPYTLICLPLKLEAVDGSPARVLLVKDR
jgi:arylformamidase